MRTFSVFKVSSDGISDWIRSVPSLDSANAKVYELAESWPGESIISEQCPDNDGSGDPIVECAEPSSLKGKSIEAFTFDGVGGATCRKMNATS